MVVENAGIMVVRIGAVVAGGGDGVVGRETEVM